MSWTPDFGHPIRTVMDGYRRLIGGSWNDRIEIAFWIALVLLPAILVPAEFIFIALIPCLIAALIESGIWQFAETMENKRFDDPVYKKNLQRLIERNRKFEDARE